LLDLVLDQVRDLFMPGRLPAAEADVRSMGESREFLQRRATASGKW
jgi:hypothetical protein